MSESSDVSTGEPENLKIKVHSGRIFWATKDLVWVHDDS